MAIRSGDTPMDFEYGTQGGQVDPNSAWIKNAGTRMNSFKSEDRSHSSISNFQPPNLSPSRKLTQPTNPFPETPTTKPLPLLPLAFANIRDPPSFDYSSADNPSSPDNADNESTPEPSRPLPSNITLNRGHHSPTKPPTSQDFNFKVALTPGRGEIPRRNYTDALVRRVHKRKRRDLDRDNHIRIGHRLQSADSDDNSDAHSRPSSRSGPPKTTASPQPTGLIPSLFTFIDTHPTLPHTLSLYAQFLLNISAVLFLIYLCYSFWATVRSDVDKKSEEAAAATLAEMAICAREYVANRCERESRVPAMEGVCDGWEKCMNRDPGRVGRARVSAHTFAEILNGFVEPISVKAMIFCLVLVFGCIFVSNIAFGFFRHKAYSAPPHAPFPSAPVQHFPQQQRHVDFGGGQQFFTPYQQRVGEPGMVFGVDHSGRVSPSKRVGYR